MKLRYAAITLSFLTLWVGCKPGTAPGTSPGPLDVSGGVLKLYNWEDYFSDDLIKEFEQAFDCTVEQEYFDDNDQMIQVLQDGGVSQYDIVFPSGFAIPRMVDAGLLAPLHHERIPNLVNIDPRFANPGFDPGNLFTAPFLWGTNGLLVRSEGPTPPPSTWGLLFDPELQTGKFTIIDSSREVLGSALLFLGADMNSTDDSMLARASDLMSESFQRSEGFLSGSEARDAILAGELDIGFVYNGDVVEVMQERDDLYYILPDEGSQIWLDNFAIPSGAPNRDLAEAFINFCLEAENGAKLADDTGYATPNKASLPFIDSESLANPIIYPTEEDRDRLLFVRYLGSDEAKWQEAWSQATSR